MNITVQIKEILSKDIVFEVPKGKENDDKFIEEFAKEKFLEVYDQYTNENIVLTADDFADRSFIVYDNDDMENDILSDNDTANIILNR